MAAPLRAHVDENYITSARQLFTATSIPTRQRRPLCFADICVSALPWVKNSATTPKEKSPQWMLNPRPRNIPALTRAAHVRDLFSDPEGPLGYIKSRRT
jgi:hypothetical protein